MASSNHQRVIVFVVNAQKPGAQKLSEELIQIALQAGWEARSTSGYPIKPHFLEGADLCCVLGGDGTLLSVVPCALANEVPVFGINQGNLGFLAGYTAEQAAEAIRTVLAGDYRTEGRPVLQVRFPSGKVSFALNDVVIKHLQPNRLLGLSVSYEKEWVNTYDGDGLIFCAATGSTAYNLSAGGPILHPTLRVLAMTPICPHTLSNRSFVFPATGTVEVRLPDNHKESPLMLSLDGHLPLTSGPILPLEIELAAKTLSLIAPRNHSYFSVLRSKLKWGERPAD